MKLGGWLAVCQQNMSSDPSPTTLPEGSAFLTHKQILVTFRHSINGSVGSSVNWHFWYRSNAATGCNKIFKKLEQILENSSSFLQKLELCDNSPTRKQNKV
jgi:hypothetical protein